VTAARDREVVIAVNWNATGLAALVVSEEDMRRELFAAIAIPVHLMQPETAQSRAAYIEAVRGPVTLRLRGRT
jgi:diacylglycerol kinase